MTIDDLWCLLGHVYTAAWRLLNLKGVFENKRANVHNGVCISFEGLAEIKECEYNSN